MTWFKRDRKKIETTEKNEIPGDLWQKCPACGDILYRKELAQRAWICSKCGHHFRVAADDYLEILLDAGSFEEFDAELESVDALEFVDTRRQTGVGRQMIRPVAAWKGGRAVAIAAVPPGGVVR